MCKKFRLHFFYLLILFVFSGCTCREYEPCYPSSFYFFTRIKKDTNFITVQYQYAIGIGNESSFIIRDSLRDSQIYQTEDSILFNLPANMNKDTVKFVLVDKKMNNDTIGIAYTKKISVWNRRYCKENYATITSSKLVFLSSNLLKDSCRIEKRTNELHYLILYKK